MTDIRAARSALRGIQEKWEQIGAVPRDAREHLESGLRRVEDALRKAEETQWRRSNPEALARAEGTVAQLRSTIAQLEQQLARARERGDADGRAHRRGSADRPPGLARGSRAHAGQSSPS